MKKTLITLITCAALSGCSSLTMDKLNADIQEATTISCVLASGAQIAYTVGTTVVEAADIQATKFVQASSKIANGSAAVCAALIKINAQVATQPTTPAASATLVSQPQ